MKYSNIRLLLFIIALFLSANINAQINQTQSSDYLNVIYRLQMNDRHKNKSLYKKLYRFSTSILRENKYWNEDPKDTIFLITTWASEGGLPYMDVVGSNYRFGFTFLKDSVYFDIFKYEYPNNPIIDLVFKSDMKHIHEYLRDSIDSSKYYKKIESDFIVDLVVKWNMNKYIENFGKQVIHEGGLCFAKKIYKKEKNRFLYEDSIFTAVPPLFISYFYIGATPIVPVERFCYPWKKH